MLEPLTSVAVALRGIATLEALPHVADLVSAFLDFATPERWSIARASERGELRLLRRLAVREALIPGDPFVRSHLAAEALANAVRSDSLEIARWVCCAYCPSVVPLAAMRAAAELGRLRVLEWLFARYPSVRPGMFVAEKAAESGRLDVLQWLLPRLEHSPTDTTVVDLFCAAARSGHLESTRWLLGQLTPTETEGAYTSTALAGAITEGHFEVAKFLVGRGIHLKEWHHGHVAFCARMGNLELVQWVHAQQLVGDSVGWIDVAAAAGHLHIIEWVHANVPNDICTVDAMTSAAKCGHLEIVQWLHANRTEGCTTLAMDLAAELGHLEVVQWLHKHRSEGCTTFAMDGAADAGHLEIVQWLHAHRPEGCSTGAMDRAAASGHLEVVRWLHEHRSEGCTSAAMDEAAGRGHLDVVQWLQDNRTEGCTATAMDLAARNGHLHVVEWLHANRTEGCTVQAMDRAELVAMLKWLYEHQPARCTHTATVMAAFHGNLKKLVFLREKGLALVDEVAPIEAVMSKHFDVFRWLRANYPEHVDMDEFETDIRPYILTWSAWRMFVQFESGLASTSEAEMAIEELRSQARTTHPLEEIAWCVSNENVSTVILGASNIRQLEENLKANEIVDKITPEVKTRIDEVVRFVPKAVANETRWSGIRNKFL